MPHPKETKKIGGLKFHLEDKNLTYHEAKALQKHLKRTEDKKSRITQTHIGYNVWWR